MKGSSKVLLVIGILFFIAFSCIACCFVSWLILNGASKTGVVNERVISNSKSGKADKIAIVDVSGVIIEGTEDIASSSIASPERISNDLINAGNDDHVKAIILKENTPGGTVIGAQKICDTLKKVTAKKPVITYIESMGASGGYYIASCTNYIVVNKEAITGSIGVILQEYDLSGLYEKIGVKEKVLTNTNGTLKSGQDFFQSGSETEKIYKTLLDESYEEFINIITEGRKNGEKKLTRADILKLSDGRIYSGRQAVLNGLADKLGGQDEAIAVLSDRFNVSKDLNIVEYVRPDFFGSLFGVSLNSFIPGAQEAALVNELSKAMKPGVKVMLIYKN